MNGAVLASLCAGNDLQAVLVEGVRGFHVHRGQWVLVPERASVLEPEGARALEEPCHIYPAHGAPDGLLSRNKFPSLWGAFPKAVLAVGFWGHTFVRVGGETICRSFNALAFLLPSPELREFEPLFASSYDFGAPTAGRVACHIVVIVRVEPFGCGTGRRVTFLKNGVEHVLTQYKRTLHDSKELATGEKYLLMGVRRREGGILCNGSGCQFISRESFVKMAGDELFRDLEVQQNVDVSAARAFVMDDSV